MLPDRDMDSSREDAPLRDVVVAGQLLCSLETAALHLARQEYPDLNVGHCIAKLDEIAARVRPMLSATPDPPEILGMLNDVIFRDLEFRGNHEDYYSPRNSFLNDVIERRLGIPITLATVYMAVARRVGLELQGTAFPGHFLVRHTRSGWPILVDCFHGGRIMTEEECLARLHAMGWPTWDPRFVEPVPAEAILRRMLNNLKAIYLERHDWERLRRTVLQILVVAPDDHDERYTLGLALAGVGRLSAAIAEMERFLAQRPGAPNRGAVESMVRALRDRLG